jgi:outer membrane protein TolC
VLAALLCAVAGGLACGLAGGCSSKAGIDRELQAMLDAQSAKLDADAPSPKLRPRLEPAIDEAMREVPTTVNPGASEIRISAASPTRDVAARLDELSRQSGLLGVPIGSETRAAEVLPEQVLTLEKALRASQRTGRELLSAQEEYILTAIRVLTERHLWGPRLFNDTTLGLAGQGDDGRFEHALSIVNQLRVTQRLPSGGNVEAAWVWDATEQLRESSTQGYVQGSRLVFRGDIPLLRGAGDVAREDLVQAERDLVYQAREFERFRREFLVDIASDYFELLQTKASITNQRRQIASLELFNRATAARVEAGRLDAFQVDITRNRLASAQSQLAGLVDQYNAQLDRFRVRLGLPLDTPFDVSDELPALPEPFADLRTASDAALAYRLDLQNSADRVEDRKRQLANARNGVLPDLNLNATGTLPTDPDDNTGGLGLSPDDASYRVGATLSLPLDRTNERLAVRSAQIRFERAAREHDRLTDTIVVESRAAVRAVEVARFQLNLAEQQVEINKRRLRGQRLQEDTLRPQEIVDTENDLLQAENDRDRARTRLRSAVLAYLLTTDQLRVTREGSLEQVRAE